MSLQEIAIRNIETHLKDNPCRGVVGALLPSGNPMQLSWIMGRSENSQNRVYTIEGDTMRTEAADPSKMKDPSLIIYNAMRKNKKGYVVTNGVHTDTVIDLFSKNHMHTLPSDFVCAMATHYCEPDPVTFTPRIAAFQWLEMPNDVFLTVLRADPFAKRKWIETAEKTGEDPMVRLVGEELFVDIGRRCGLNHRAFPTERNSYQRQLAPGFGYMITTYNPGSKSLDSFDKTPLLVATKATLEETMQFFWEKLEPEWRVALGGREIDQKNNYRFAEPINRFQKVEVK